MFKNAETNEKQKMLKKNWTNAEKKRKNMDKKACHNTLPPNKYTDSELYWENLTQYSILTLIEVQH